jgi:PadR family transcriptional regulator PadR
LKDYTMCSIVCITQNVTHGRWLLLVDLAKLTNSDLFENLRLELRRGSLIIAVLAQLRQEHYGYALRKALADRGMEIEESTLYPLLRRLESQGLLESEWREEAKRNKRFYRLSKEGAHILEQLIEEWRNMNSSLKRIV